MKIWVKIFVILGLLPMFFKYDVNATDDDISLKNAPKDRFINPIFYQNLSNDDHFYVLTPDSKFFESAEVTNSVKCSLLTNEENHISLICNDCTDGICSKKAQYIHDFILSEDKQKDGLYYIKHRVTDKYGNSILQETITTDGYLARRPDLL